MSAADDAPQTSVDEDSRGRGARPAKEKKKRRRSRSKQKEVSESPGVEQEFSSFGVEDDGENSCSSTPKYERADEPCYPASRLICGLCYCGEKSLLGQGDLARYAPSSGFNPLKKAPLRARSSHELLYGSPGSNGSKDVGEKITKTAAVQRRGSKQIRDTVKVAPKMQEHIDELSTVGCSEALDISQVFEPTGHVTAHHCCAAWSEGVTQNESYDLLCVDKAVYAGMSQRCHYCSRYGATIKCRAPKCERLFHYPCAAGSGCYQDIKSMSLLCTDHLSLATTIADPDELNCAVCDDPGQISDLLFCTSCGHHYHGDCLYPHVDVNPVVRAGWQCPECKICQTCRQPGDDNKMLVCDVCDKGYHTYCLRPAMTFIPKNGWCCKNCRRCTDCGSRTPGNGPSSRWHINYQVCDKCYQLRNKGSSCPVCRRAYRNIPAGRVEMTQCKGCKKWVHWGCEEEPDHVERCHSNSEDYECPRCRNPIMEAEHSDSSLLGVIDMTQTVTQAIETPSQESMFSPPLNPATMAQEIVNVEDKPIPVLMEESDTSPMVATNIPFQSPPIASTRKRASTSSSIGSEKGNFALKGSSTDPMLCVGEDTASNEGESHPIVKTDLESPPRKVRHISSEDTLSAKDLKTDRHSSVESNLSSLFTDENANDTMQLFGVETLSHSGPTKTIPSIMPSGMISPDAKSYKITETFVSPTHPKVTLSPLGSPASYGSPPIKPPGPGMGKPGAMFGTGKPFGHKRKPATARSKGKGKGKGQKRGTWSGARKRPKGGIAGKGGATSAPIDRNFPRRVRRGFPRQCSTNSSLAESGPLSPTTKVEPPLQFPPADDEYGDSMHNTVVLCSTEDTFTLSQDMCVVCGSLGKGSEGRLITCSQCGQCYHPYCVNLKLTKVVLRKGWRCLDCTVCEECGQVDDPAHLLLCDDCDISYHTHCLKPPLQHVPKGGWKCKWCVRCIHCGSTSPGKNCEWASNYTACGPCASLTHCPRCKRLYKDEDVIMQCGTCERWLHSLCESLFTESDIEKVFEKGYECFFCRPKGATPPHLTLGPPTDPMYDSQAGVFLGRTRSEVDTVKEYHKDCHALTIAGYQHIQEQMQKYMGLSKKRPTVQRGRGRKSSLELTRKIETPPVLPTLDKPKQSLGQPINVAAAVAALQEPGDITRKMSEDGNLESGMDGRIVPVQLPVSTAIINNLSSATATATEDSGMEGNDRDNTAIGLDALKSPVGDSEIGLLKNDDVVGLPIRDETRSALGVKDGGIKRRRKPYRPGIGGFMVRQRGRGGLFKPRSRHGPPAGNKAVASDSKTDTVASETASDAATSLTPLHTPYDLPKDGAGQAIQPQPGASAQFVPPTGSEPNVSVVSPLKLKISTTKTRKRRKKLIEQFPPYLQDAFFGKKVIMDAKAKSSPLDNLNENPASPDTGYGPKQSRDSQLMLPDRLTQRLESLVANQASALANTVQTSSSNSRSQRHSSLLQDDDPMLMDRENEQELLGVLPDLPFKDEELLGMFSSELKPEQGANDSHENILSPSSLEKMVTDGLGNIDSSDMAALFSDVLNHQTEPTTKQENLNPQQSDSHADMQHMLSSDKMSEVKSAEQIIAQQGNQAAGMTVTSNIQTQQAADVHRQVEQQRKLAIEQELQQIEIKQRQQQMSRQHVIQRQMSANLPLTGYGMGLQDVPGHHMMAMGQNRQSHGASVTPGPHGMPMVGQHVDPSRPRSHHTTPVMSPVPMVGQQSGPSIAQIHHPGQSPHPTPPPSLPMFVRQTSMPVLPGHGELHTISQMHPSMQGHITTGMPGPQITQAIPQQRVQGSMHVQPPASGTPGLEMHALHTGTSSPRAQSLYVDQAGADQGFASGQTAAVTHHVARTTPTALSVTHQGTSEGITKYQEASDSSLSLPPEAYLTNVDPTSQAVLGPDQVPPAIVSQPNEKTTTPVLQESISTSATDPNSQSSYATETSTTKQVLVTQENVTATVSQPVQSTSAIEQQPNQPEDGGAPPLPDFSSDTNLFDPAPLPWPLGTDLEGDCLSVNQRNILKWEKDEPLGPLATISPVLYANVKYQSLKEQFPDWQTRAKQIAKLWRKASTDERAPYLLKARDNRAHLKISRERNRGDQSKTPTPPIGGEDSEHKDTLKQESSELTALTGDVPQAVKSDESKQKSPVQSQLESETTPPKAGSSSELMQQHSFARPDTTPSRESGMGQLLPPDYKMTVKQQQPTYYPASAYYEGSTVTQSESMPQTSAKDVHVKVERRQSTDVPMQPSIHESPTKTAGPVPVTRSLSVGARIMDLSQPAPTTPKANASDQQLTGTPMTPHTPVFDPKNRRRSADSQIIQTQDIKPPIPISPNPAQIRQVIFQQSTQRSSRRARLWEQSQPPPPPYPSHTAQSSGAVQATPRFMYSQVGPRGQLLQLQGPRVGMLPTGPQSIIRTPSPGMHGSIVSFPFEGATPHNIPPGHSLAQGHHSFSGGVHPVRGQHPPGAYIELRHTNQSDPATRRQNILRISNACSSTPPHSLPSSTATDTTVTTESKVSQTKSSEVSSQPSIVKSEDPFAGGHMPHDDAIEALLRSDEFKDLHFQGPGSSTAPNTSASDSATTSASTQMVTLASTPSTVVIKQEKDNEVVLSVEKKSAVEENAQKPTQSAPGDAGKIEKEAKVDSAEKGDDKMELERKVGEKVKLERKSDEMEMEKKEDEKAELNEKSDEKDESGKEEDGKSQSEKEVDEKVKSAETVKKIATQTEVVQDTLKEKTEDVLKTDHSYFKNKTGVVQDAAEDIVKPSNQQTSPAKAKVTVDIPKEQATTSLRGVGLTPPPESEVATFIPNEEESRSDAPINLTVSNVITVPGTPPCDSTNKTYVDASEKSKETDENINESEKKAGDVEVKQNEEENEVTESEKVTEKAEKQSLQVETVPGSDAEGKTSESESIQSFSPSLVTSAATSVCSYEIQPLPKSPCAPLPVQHLVKYAKLKDAPSEKKEVKQEVLETQVMKETGEKEMKDDTTDEKPESELKNAENIPHEENTKPEAMITEESIELKPTPDVQEAKENKEVVTQSALAGLPQSKTDESSEPMDVVPSEPKLPQNEADQQAIKETIISQEDDKSISISDSKRNKEHVDDAFASTKASSPVSCIVQESIATSSSHTSIPTVEESSMQEAHALDSTMVVMSSQIQMSTGHQPHTTVADQINVTPTHMAAVPPYPEHKQDNMTLQSAPVSQAPALTPELPVTPVRSSMPPQHPGLTTSVTPPQVTRISPTKDETKTTTTPPRQKPLLIKEQPLLLQELLEEEKREQEKARREKMRHTQTLLQQQVVPQPPGMPQTVFGPPGPPGVEIEKVTPDAGIDNIKMEFLSRMNQAAQAGLPVQPGTDVSIAAPGTSPLHQQAHQGHWAPHVAGIQQAGMQGFGDPDLRYRNWLIQHQQLMAIQLPKQEALVQAKKTRKQSLMKKRNQYKKNNKEFSAEDNAELQIVIKQYTEAQQQLEKLRSDQKQHAELIQEFNYKHSAGAPGIQQQQMIVTQQFQPRLGARGQPQQMMMQQGQQQILFKSIPASSNVAGTSVANVQSVAMGMQQQQQSQVVIATQQLQQQQAIMTQFQKMQRTSPTNPGQLQQVMINQHPIQQQQQMQIKPPQQATHPRPPFMGSQQSSTHTAVSVSPGSGHQTHDAMMQMQLQELRELEVARQQTTLKQNTEKQKPKRRRKKKKSQAEKEAEEQALAQQQMHHLHQPHMQGPLPVTNQPPGTTWIHRAVVPLGMGQMQQPQMMMIQQQRFAMPSGPAQLQHGGLTNVPPHAGFPMPSQLPQSSMPLNMVTTSQPPLSTHGLIQPPVPTLPVLSQSSASAATSTPTASSFTSPQPMALGPTQKSTPTMPTAPSSLSTTSPAFINATTTPPNVLHSAGPSHVPPMMSPNMSHPVQQSGSTPGSYVTSSTHVITPGTQSHIVTERSVALASPSTTSSSVITSAQHFMPSDNRQKVTPPKSTPLSMVPTLSASQLTSQMLVATPSLSSASILSSAPTVTPTISSADRTFPSPRIQSPGQAAGNFEGLSEAEIAILMAHDPDLNSVPGTPTTPVTGVSAAPPTGSILDQDNKSPKDDPKKKKKLKKGYVMDERAKSTIDSSIETVIRLGVEYEDRRQAAGQEGKTIPSPWQLEPKPTKFPPKKPEHSIMGDMHGDLNKNKELLKHLLKTGQMTGMPGVNMSDGTHAVFGQMGTPIYGQPGLLQGMPTSMMTYNPMQQEMGMGMMPYAMKDGDMDQSQKKKRSRRSSKEVGPDGKPIKRRRSTKTKTGEQQQFQLGSITEGGMQMMMQGLTGKPGVMTPMVQFPGGIITSGSLSVGQVSPGQAGGPDLKTAQQWKQLPLLRLIEPEIRKTHHMCVPKGTGLTERKLLLSGKPGDSTYKEIPDLYEILLQLEKKSEKAIRPPTPPASLPPSPTRKQQPGQITTSTLTKAETTSSDTVLASATTIPDTPTSLANKYGPLGLAPQGAVGSLPQLPQVTVPDSLPTPPHQGIDEKEILTPKAAEDIIMAPSSPEMDGEDDWSTHSLTSLRNDDFALEILKTPPNVKSEKIRDAPSPTLPFMSCPKLKVPTDFGKGGPLNDKDAVSVTIEFDNANIDNIKKSLMLLSRILDTSIISYSMEEMIKPDRKIKAALSQAVKEEHSAVMPAQTSQPNQTIKTQPDEISNINLSRHRRCVNCKAFVTGNGVRKPQFDESIYEEDVIFCHKDCYIRNELSEKKVSVTPTKKKFKASHVYQRQTQKISMETLLERFPDEEPVTPLKNTRSSLDSAFVPSGVQDPLRGMSAGGRGRGRRRGLGDEMKVSAKRWKGLKWKKWTVNVTVVKSSNKPPIDVEALMVKYGAALKPPPELVDKRVCVFCGVRGDGDTHTIARLLNVDVDRWVHLNCALWSAEVYETQGGALINVDLALRRSESVLCCLCQKQGATIHCHRPRCVNTYHCRCALDSKCVFFKDKTVLCPTHAPKPGISATGLGMQQHHSSDTLRSLAVYRKVYIQRPETKQIASIMQQGELAQGEKNYMLRVGALIFENVGQLATNQMATCHSKTAIYPIGYKATRMFWSSTNMRRRCRYECTVHEVDGKPMFRMKYKAALPGKNKPDKIKTHSDEFISSENVDVGALWMDILQPLEKLRSQHNVLKLFPPYIKGEKLFGLTTSVVSRILESLPNIELCSEYKFRYGRTPLLEVPLAINPTGCARSEPHIKQHRKKPHTLISNLISEYYESSGIGDASSLYGKQFVHSKSSQYRKMKQEWRSNVYLARSRIQGLGLFAARDIEPGTMVIEYIGDIIRIEVSEKREKMYEATNRGVYMFKLDSDHIVDATVTGGPARYINHSCKPNCVAEVVNFEKEKKIMIVSNRHILKGEELSYDYKFDFEDEGRKIPCLCGASNCKKWMN